jgi:preprotein translocase subunit Sec63
MTRKEWAAIKAAADLLELGEKATLSEIKKAYRKLSKKHHPDVRKNTKKKVEKVDMHKLTEAAFLWCQEMMRNRMVKTGGLSASERTITGVKGRASQEDPDK